MNLDGSELIAGLFGSGIGFVLFRYGKKMSRFPQLIVGLILLVAPYFLPGVGWIIAVTVLLLGLLWGALRMGY